MPLDDENYNLLRHDGLRLTNDNYKSYFLKKNTQKLNSTTMNMGGHVKRNELQTQTHKQRNSLNFESSNNSSGR